MPKAYLKCRHYGIAPICFSGEYAIIFRELIQETGERNNWCIINKSDLVKKIDEEKGLVRVDLLGSQINSFLVEINNPGDHKLSRFYVPRKEIVFSVKEYQENIRW